MGTRGAGAGTSRTWSSGDTDDDRIRQARKDSALSILTRDRSRLRHGSVAEAASASTATVIVNIQGDEALIDSVRHRRRRPRNAA